MESVGRSVSQSVSQLLERMYRKMSGEFNFRAYWHDCNTTYKTYKLNFKFPEKTTHYA